MNSQSHNKKLKVYLPERRFLMPYLQRELPDYEISIVDTPAQCRAAIVEPQTDTDNFGADTVVLRCPNIVGTGMTGLPMMIARRIANGSFYHLGQNDARLSTIHASDVAVALAMAIDSPGIYTATDCNDPTFHDFAEALAHRLNGKRILTLNSRWINWIISPALKKTITRTQIYDGTEFCRKFNFSPHPVVDYLRTHIYDDESL